MLSISITFFDIVTAIDNEGSIQDADAVKASLDENQEEKKGDARGFTGLEK